MESEKNFQYPDQLIDAVFNRPFTKIRHLTDADIYAENTAYNYLNERVEMGILEKRKIKGRYYYKNREMEHFFSYQQQIKRTV